MEGWRSDDEIKGNKLRERERERVFKTKSNLKGYHIIWKQNIIKDKSISSFY